MLAGNQGKLFCDRSVPVDGTGTRLCRCVYGKNERHENVTKKILRAIRANPGVNTVSTSGRRMVVASMVRHQGWAF